MLGDSVLRLGLCKKVKLRSILKIAQNKIMGYVQI